MKIIRTRLLLLICLINALPLWAQQPADSTEAGKEDQEEEAWFKPEINPVTKIGMKLGSGISTMMGSETNTNSFYFNLMGGMYVKHRLKKHLLIQPELVVSRRGSNFDNGPTGYSRIQCYYIDLPVLLMYGFDKENRTLGGIGIQYSRLINATIFQGTNPLPESSSPQLNDNDFMLVGGGQYHTPFVGFQLMVKYGLININEGLLPSLQPPSQGKSLHNFCIEFNFLF